MSRHSYVPLLALLALTACGVGGTDAAAVTADGDSDGITVHEGDCDDADPTVKPGAEDRTVDGLDQDCDGIDGPDEDGDGFVDAAAGGDDCDDRDAAIFPGAAEIWDDGIDQDCDGLADVEDAECSADLTLTLSDGTEIAVDGCTVWAVEMGVDFDPDEAPSVSELWLTLDGVTGDGADCSLSIHQEGVCGAGFYDFQNESASWVTINTNDCPGVSGADEGEFGASSGYLQLEAIETDGLEMTQSGDPLALALSGRVSAVNSYLSMSGAFAFSLTAPTTDIDGTPFCAVEDGDADDDAYIDPYFGGDDCEAENASVNPGAEEVCEDGIDNNCDGTLCGLASASLSTAYQYTGEADVDNAGLSVSGAGDVNGDGYDDMLVGAFMNDDGPGSDAGAAYLLLGSAAPASASLSTAIQYTGEAEWAQAGVSVSGAGDVNGDGYHDMLVGSSYDVYLLLGSAAPASASLSAAYHYTVEASYRFVGYSVSGAGDVNGDGYDDMLVGTYGLDRAAYLVLGSDAPASASLSTTIQYTGDLDRDDAGISVSGAGDVNGDGYEDMVVGSNEAYLLLGNAAPASASLSTAIQYTGDACWGGCSPAGAGDINGDGYDDMLVGAERYSDAWGDAGAAYLVLGSAAPVSASLSTAIQYTGEAAANRAGRSVSGSGDVDGDGYDDMLVGAYSNGDGPGGAAGAAYLVFGSASPAPASLSTAIQYTGEAASDLAGYSVSGAGDVNGDGSDDMLIGAYLNDDGGPSAGAAYLLLGANLGTGL